MILGGEFDWLGSDPDPVTGTCYDVSENRIEAAVEEQAALSASYRAPLGGTGWQWLGRLGLRYQGSEFMEMLNLMELPAVTTMNGTLSLSNDNWRIVLFGNNLTNEDQPWRVRASTARRRPAGRAARIERSERRYGFGVWRYRRQDRSKV